MQSTTVTNISTWHTTVPPSKVCPFFVWFASQPFTPGIGVGGKHPPVVCLVPEISLPGVPPWGLWYSQKLLNSWNWRLETIGYLKTTTSLEKKPNWHFELFRKYKSRHRMLHEMELCNTFRQKYQNSSLHGSSDVAMAPTALELIRQAIHHYVLHALVQLPNPNLTLTQNLAVKDHTYGIWQLPRYLEHHHKCHECTCIPSWSSCMHVVVEVKLSRRLLQYFHEVRLWLSAWVLLSRLPKFKEICIHAIVYAHAIMSAYLPTNSKPSCYSKSPTVYDMFWSTLGLISCANIEMACMLV